MASTENARKTNFAFVRAECFCLWLTRKNVIVEPLSSVPYDISVWPAKSSAFSMGVIIRSTVRNAAKLAVYDDIIMSVKNHQIPDTMRVDVAFLIISVITCDYKPHRTHSTVTDAAINTEKNDKKKIIENWFVEKCVLQFYLRIQIAPLLHESSNHKPKTVCNRKLIFDDVIFNVTRMRIMPFGETCHNVNRQRNQTICSQNVQPNVDRQRIHERK